MGRGKRGLDHKYKKEPIPLGGALALRLFAAEIVQDGCIEAFNRSQRHKTPELFPRRASKAYDDDNALLRTCLRNESNFAFWLMLRVSSD